MSPEAAQHALEMVETLRQVEARAARVVKIDDLVALISHEFRNPIQAALNQLHLLEQSAYGPLSATQENVIHGLGEEIARLSSLTHVISDLAHADRAKRRIRFVEIPIATLVEELEAEMQVVCTTAKVGFRKAVQWGVTELWSEPIRLQMALRNILIFAARSLASSSVVLEVSANDSGTDFTVRADGGAADTANLLAHRSGDSNAGIGLFLSERLIELLGGFFRIVSEAGATTLQVTLPDRSHEESR